MDSLVVIPNERLKFFSTEKITLVNAFDVADDVLRQGVKSISELIKTVGFINLDFADVSAIMRDAGHAHMGVGRASGKDKAEVAANAAVSSPLLETTIDGAHGVIINFTSSPDIQLDEVEQAAKIISDAAHPEANVIFGVAFDDTLQDEIIVTVIATGFGMDGAVKRVDPARFKDEDEKDESQEKVDDVIDIISNSDDSMGFEDESEASGNVGLGMDDNYFDAIDDIFSNRN